MLLFLPAPHVPALQTFKGSQWWMWVKDMESFIIFLCLLLSKKTSHRKKQTRDFISGLKKQHLRRISQLPSKWLLVQWLKKQPFIFSNRDLIYFYVELLKTLKKSTRFSPVKSAPCPKEKLGNHNKRPPRNKTTKQNKTLSYLSRKT